MSNKVYDILKWVVMVALPALSTFYCTLSSIWGWPYVTEVAGSIAACTALLGALLGISSANYRRNKE